MHEFVKLIIVLSLTLVSLSAKAEDRIHGNAARCAIAEDKTYVLKLVFTASGFFRTASLTKMKRLLETINTMPKIE